MGSEGADAAGVKRSSQQPGQTSEHPEIHLPSLLRVLRFSGYFQLVPHSDGHSLFLPTVQGYYQEEKRKQLSRDLPLNFH